jgi:hypothetical protein
MECHDRDISGFLGTLPSFRRDRWNQCRQMKYHAKRLACVLHREQLDLDDYSFSLPGKEESKEGQIETVLGAYFWVNQGDGEVLFDD